MTLWQRTSARGNPYFAGYLGHLGLVMFKDDKAELKPGCEAVWEVFISEREADERRPRAVAAESRPPSKRSSESFHQDESAAGQGLETPVKRRRQYRPSRKAAESSSGDGRPPLDDPLDDIGPGRAESHATRYGRDDS
jgi:hypothetical protein